MTFPCCGGDPAADRKIDIVREAQNAGISELVEAANKPEVALIFPLTKSRIPLSFESRDKRSSLKRGVGVLPGSGRADRVSLVAGSDFAVYRRKEHADL